MRIYLFAPSANKLVCMRYPPFIQNLSIPVVNVDV